MSCKNIDVSRTFTLNITLGSVYLKVTKCGLSKGRMQFEEKGCFLLICLWCNRWKFVAVVP